MNRKHLALFVCIVLCLTLVGSGAAQSGIAEGAGTDAASVALSTAFTYQGQLKKGGSPANAVCSFQASLWDAVAGGTQKGSTQNVNNVNVVNGLFTVQLDFGDQFTGDARWLQTAIKCGADAGFTALSPRRSLDAVPYALSLRPGASIVGSGDAVLTVLNAATTGASNAIHADSGTPSGSGLWGTSFGGGYGVSGGTRSASNSGIFGYNEGNGAGVVGDGRGSGAGVAGYGKSGYGVTGLSQTGYAGVYGTSNSSNGVFGSVDGDIPRAGVYGKNDGAGFGVFGQNTKGGYGVYGTSVSGVAVRGDSTSGAGVWGESTNWQGVYGHSTNQAGVVGESQNFDGVWGIANSSSKAGVVAINHTTGTGLYARSVGGGYAAFFDGKAATKALEIWGGADLAERFQVTGETKLEPGTLMVIDEANAGHLRQSTEPYDTKVAGVVSGAGGVEPGLTLQQEGVMEGDTVVAIAGRVYVRAEALTSPIKPGDLLTTSTLPGHAMKALDPSRSHGAVVGKAMTELKEGTGLVLVLVNLQ